MALEFDMTFDPAYGHAVAVAPDVLRLTVENPSPFTFHGTNTYIVGKRSLAVIDPGPEDEAHLEAIL
ncbi:MBL fold metallo-hydrolase, partial [Rhizobiaceae sp. 2RAB30]